MQFTIQISWDKFLYEFKKKAAAHYSVCHLIQWFQHEPMFKIYATIFTKQE